MNIFEFQRRVADIEDDPDNLGVIDDLCIQWLTEAVEEQRGRSEGEVRWAARVAKGMLQTVKELAN